MSQLLFSVFEISLNGSIQLWVKRFFKGLSLNPNQIVLKFPKVSRGQSVL